MEEMNRFLKLRGQWSVWLLLPFTGATAYTDTPQSTSISPPYHRQAQVLGAEGSFRYQSCEAWTVVSEADESPVSWHNGSWQGLGGGNHCY